MSVAASLSVFGGALLVALGVDRFLGEPPVRWHPVVWIGNYLNLAAPHVLRGAFAAPAARDLKAFALGALAWSLGAAAVLTVATLLQWTFLQGPAWLAAVLLGLALKPLLAWAMLSSEVQAVEDALAQSLDTGRQRLAMLVSRNTASLSESEVRESAIESLAENLNDSVVAPIFWFVLFGLPGAALYRFANTADAMWGYPGLRNGLNWQWAGKWAARADDVLSWLPARLTALLLALIAGRLNLHALRLEARKTPSPNSGWPMAAMALALGVCLHKPGAYALNPSGGVSQPENTVQALRYASKVLLAAVLCAQLAIVLIAFAHFND